MRKNIRMRFRITDKQKEHIDRKCKEHGINNSEYLRRLVDSDMGKLIPMQTREQLLVRKELIYEVNRIGNNINQIARNVNMLHYSESEKKKLFALAKKVMELLENEGKGGNNHDVADGCTNRRT